MRRFSILVTVLAMFGLACNDGGIQAGQNQPPVAEAGDNITVFINEQVTFDGSASHDPDGTIVNYAWDFGTGSDTDVGQQVSFAWDTPGAYTVTLTVTDNEGATGTDAPTVTIDVEPFPGIYAVVPSPASQPCGIGGNVSFVANTVDVSINGAVMDSDWHVDDLGLTVVQPSTGPISGSTFAQDSVYEQATVDPLFVMVCGTDTIITTYTNTWTGDFNGDGTITSTLIQNISDDCGLLSCSLPWDIEGTKTGELP